MRWLTGGARETVTPCPTPGEMSALLASAIWYSTTSWVTGGNGLPAAMSARRPVQAIRSADRASECEVGLDSGMMTGRTVCAAISVTIGSVNTPGCVEVPISTLGRLPSRRPAGGSPPTGQGEGSASKVAERQADDHHPGDHDRGGSARTTLDSPDRRVMQAGRGDARSPPVSA